MEFDRPLCPECQHPARAVATTLAGLIEIAPTEAGSFTRTGQSIRWDSETPVVVEGRHLLRCGCGAVWLARRLDEGGGRVLPFSPEEPSGTDPDHDLCPPQPPLDRDFSARIRAFKPQAREEARRPESRQAADTSRQPPSPLRRGLFPGTRLARSAVTPTAPLPHPPLDRFEGRVQRSPLGERLKFSRSRPGEESHR
jgi:hypothetical protein